MALSPAGLWWQDDSDRSMDAKIQTAAARYIAKYGAVPDTCYVHPSLLVNYQPGLTVSLGNERIRVLPLPTMMYPIHFWIGEFDTRREDIPVSNGPEILRSHEQGLVTTEPPVLALKVKVRVKT